MKDEDATGFTEKDRQMLTAVYRGMYGDPQNNQPGVVEVQGQHTKWIEGANRKIYFLSGVGAAVGYVFSKAVDYFTTGKH